MQSTVVNQNCNLCQVLNSKILWKTLFVLTYVSICGVFIALPLVDTLKICCRNYVTYFVAQYDVVVQYLRYINRQTTLLTQGSYSSTSSTRKLDARLLISMKPGHYGLNAVVTTKWQMLSTTKGLSWVPSHLIAYRSVTGKAASILHLTGTGDNICSEL